MNFMNMLNEYIAFRRRSGIPSGTHIVGAELVDQEGYCRPTIICHNDVTDPERDCLLLEEADCEEYQTTGDCEIGGYSGVFGHGHPVEGCAVKQYLDAGGIEAISWGSDHDLHKPVPLPVEVTVGWQDEYPELQIIPPDSPEPTDA